MRWGWGEYNIYFLGKIWLWNFLVVFDIVQMNLREISTAVQVMCDFKMLAI